MVEVVTAVPVFSCVCLVCFTLSAAGNVGLKVPPHSGCLWIFPGEDDIFFISDSSPYAKREVANIEPQKRMYNFKSKFFFILFRF